MPPPLRDELRQLSDGLIESGRLAGACLLAEASMSGRRRWGAEMVLRFEQARALLEVGARHLRLKPAPVQWMRPPSDRGWNDGESLDPASTAAAHAAWTTTLARRLRDLERLLAGRYGDALVHALGQIRPTLAEGHADLALPEPRPRVARPVQTWRGPSHISYPPDYDPRHSAETLREPQGCRAHVPHEASPFFWCLSAREGMAALACTLSILEYDGMPLAFYLDLARQAWDETRHAQFFYSAAERWAPAAIDGSPEGGFWGSAARAHLETGAPLPVPRERALYAATWISDLKDRLGFLQVDDESGSVLVFREMLGGALCRSDPWLADGVERVVAEEIQHSLLGHIWLRHLIPDREERRRHIGTMKQARAPLTMAAVAHDQSLSFAELLGEGAARR